MANRFPLIADAIDNKIYELAVGDNLDLTGSNIANSAAVITLPTVTGTLATLANTETLTNKTLTSPVIASISNTGTLTLPTSTDTLIGRATTDTLTNKTISGASNTLTNIGNTSLTNSSITINGELVSLGGSITVSGGGTGQDLSQITQDIAPLYSEIYDIGTISKRFYEGYFSNKLDINGATLTGSARLISPGLYDYTLSSNATLVSPTIVTDIALIGNNYFDQSTITPEHTLGEYTDLKGTLIIDGSLKINENINVCNSITLQQEVTTLGKVTRKSVIPSTEVSTTSTFASLGLSTTANLGTTSGYLVYLNWSYNTPAKAALFKTGKKVKIYKTDTMWWELQFTSDPTGVGTYYLDLYYTILSISPAAANMGYSTPSSGFGFTSSSYIVSTSGDPIKYVLELTKLAVSLTIDDKIKKNDLSVSASNITQFANSIASNNKYISTTNWDWLVIGDNLSYIPATTSINFKNDAGTSITAITYNNNTGTLTYGNSNVGIIKNSAGDIYSTDSATIIPSTSTDSQNIAIGKNSYADASSNGTATAIGKDSSAGANSIAIGRSVTANNGTAIGTSCSVNNSGISLGTFCNAVNGGIAIGYAAVTSSQLHDIKGFGNGLHTSELSFLASTQNFTANTKTYYGVFSTSLTAIMNTSTSISALTNANTSTVSTFTINTMVKADGNTGVWQLFKSKYVLHTSSYSSWQLTIVDAPTLVASGPGITIGTNDWTIGFELTYNTYFNPTVTSKITRSCSIRSIVTIHDIADGFSSF